jgi:hypothetical protein
MRNSSVDGGAEGPEMTTTTRIRLSRAAAERLLDGAGGRSDLGRLLAAAAAPGTAEELAGEAVAVAAFAAARDTAPVPAAPARRPSSFGTAVSKLFGAKVVIGITLFAGATGGIALATNSAGAPQEPPAAVIGARPSGTSAAGGSDARVRPTGSAIVQPPGSIGELCLAWLAGDPGAVAADPAFAELVVAAGSADEVSTFCAGVAGPTGSPTPSSGSGRSGTTPGRPDTAPGNSGAAPGQSGSAPGQSGTAPGQSGEAPGQSGSAPGQSGSAPGQSGTAPGQSGNAPGRSGTAPGQSGEAPGRSGAAPGRAADQAQPPGQARRIAPQEPTRADEELSNTDATTGQ